MDWWYIAAQIIGFGGAAGLIGAYQCRTAHGFFAVQMCGHLLYIVHFAMLGALSGAVTLMIAAFRGVILFNANKAWARYPAWLWLVIAMTIAACVATWKDIFSLLPCIGICITTVAIWSANGKKIRISGLCVGSPSWLIYDIHVLSISGILCELFTISSILISIMRYGMKALDVDEAMSMKHVKQRR